MKRNQVTLAVLLAALSFFAAPSGNAALPQSQISAIKKIVADVPAAELAMRASEMLSQANTLEKADVASTTIREVASRRPATILVVVGAMAKAAPELSPMIASEASRLVAEKAAEIAKVAAAAVPQQAGQIAAAVAKVAPKSATKVARAVAVTVPDQAPNIVNLVSRSVPASQPSLVQDSTLGKLTRMSEGAASSSGNQGVITTLPGTISGQPIPQQPPQDAGTPTAGADPQRKYGSP